MRRTSNDAGYGLRRLAASLAQARRAIAPRHKTFWAILVVAVVIFCIAVWPSVRAHLQAVAVMQEVAGQPVPWMSGNLTGPVTTQALSFPIEASREIQQVGARLYLPQDKPNAPAMVIFHGVHHLG